MKTQKTTAQSVGSKISPEVLQHVKQAQEILAIIKNDGINPAFLTTPISSNPAIEQEYVDVKVLSTGRDGVVQKQKPCATQ